jgi:hypothetical protein
MRVSLSIPNGDHVQHFSEIIYQEVHQLPIVVIIQKNDDICVTEYKPVMKHIWQPSYR